MRRREPGTHCSRMRELQGRDCVSHVLRCLVGMHEHVAEHEQCVPGSFFFHPHTRACSLLPSLLNDSSTDDCWLSVKGLKQSRLHLQLMS